MDDSDRTEFKVSLKHLGIAAFFIFLIWAASGAILYNWNPKENYGTFGDMFGAVNALFSGLAFACLIFATFMQREELKLQRIELQLARKEAAETREEIRGQKEQAQFQNATLRQQTFENMYFQLLALHNELVNSIELRDPMRGQIFASGKECFPVFYSYFLNVFRNTSQLQPENETENRFKSISSAFHGFFLQHQNSVGHYFRSLYNIVKFIDDSEIVEKQRYTNLVRAQLSSGELQLLYYNCLSDYGSSKFKVLIERYALLEHVKFLDTPRGRLDDDLYDVGAFEER
jgi:Putative phage abortive infection protein